ncbi:MAG: hypothetical protein WAP20_05600, partial [Limnochordia bacterium]|nr:hypothetical protein [Bacillota bacterium]
RVLLAFSHFCCLVFKVHAGKHGKLPICGICHWRQLSYLTTPVRVVSITILRLNSLRHSPMCGDICVLYAPQTALSIANCFQAPWLWPIHAGK